MSEKWIIAMTAGVWQIDGVRIAKSLGFKVLGIDASNLASGLAECDDSLVVDIFNKDLLLESIKRKNINIQGVVSYCSEVGMLPAAWIREEFKLNGPNVETTKKLLHKNVQRKIWKDKEVENLKWILTSSISEAIDGLPIIGLPLIVKPVDSSGSRGVSKVDTYEEFESAFIKGQDASKSGLVLIEEFLDGTEYTVEAFTSQGTTRILAITEKAKVEGSRGTVASELAYPSVDEESIQKIKNKVLSAVEALGYENGPTHTEVILTKSGRAGLVEMAGRGGGFGVFSKLIPLASGVDVGTLLIKQVAGEIIDIKELIIQKNIFSLKFFPTHKKGTVNNILGFENFKNAKDIEIGSYVQVGQNVDNDFLDGNRLGYMLVKGDSLETVRKTIKEIENNISFEII